MRILLVDDHPATRLGVKVLLKRVDDAEVVGEEGACGEIERLADELDPDLVILDLELQGRTEALEVCRRLKALPHPPRILVYTARNSREDVAAASLAGADSYLHKGVEGSKLVEAVSETCTGQRLWLLGPAEQEYKARLEPMVHRAGLTTKEGEILSLLVERYTNREIAEELCLSLNTVKTHVRSILRKLGVKSRKEFLGAPRLGGEQQNPAAGGG